MNETDLKLIEKAKEDHPAYFDNKDMHVLEIGALYVNGDLRGPFGVTRFTGLDWTAGKNVDVVIPAKESKFEKDTFDVLLSMNHLEHDPDWKEGLSHNFLALKSGGLIILRWATKDSTPHGPSFDPTTKEGYYPKEVDEVIEFLEEQRCQILYQLRDLNPSSGWMGNIIAKKL